MYIHSYKKLKKFTIFRTFGSTFAKMSKKQQDPIKKAGDMLTSLDTSVATSNLVEMKKFLEILTDVSTKIASGIADVEEAEKRRADAEAEALRIEEEQLLKKLQEIQAKRGVPVVAPVQTGFGTASKEAIREQTASKQVEPVQQATQTKPVQQAPQKQYREIEIAFRDARKTAFGVVINQKGIPDGYATTFGELRLSAQFLRELLERIWSEDAIQQFVRELEEALQGIGNRYKGATLAVVHVANVVKFWQLLGHVLNEFTRERQDLKRLPYLTRNLLNGKFDNLNPSEEMTRIANQQHK
jgi:hypothetical protein